MKKSLLCAAMLAAASSVAHAQSSVTLYGIIDAGVSYLSNVGGHSQFMASDGSIQSNRWGFLGKEDLGGGLSAIFVLENGFNLNSGSLFQSDVIFNRQAWVGLASTRYGRVTLGKQYDFFWDNLTQFAMGQYAGQYSWHPGDFDHLAGTLHINNAARYVSPTIAGVTVGGLYAFPSQATSGGTGRIIAFGLRYDNGPLKIGAAYTDIHDMGVNGPVQAGTTFFPNLPPTPQLANGVTNFGAGASYQIGRSLTRLLFTSTHFRIRNDNGSLNTYEANEVFSLTPATTLMAGYWYSKLGSQHWQNVTALADYALSKRTDVYATATYLRASGGAAPVFLGIGGSNAFVDGVYVGGGGASSVAVRIGMRQKF
ncbi:porin [Paraburkholderia susongensis]|uniref:Outer membrane protein (Porin) n=1 Tax=Paraburkholderia susongensis TaxID=1515439 RepID=A0A1X7LIH4_9BURK|nr:porin [Paraburkholderia susongensis]SMG53651.1 Outer membrane protein (porin) [Paraburkholderia susongensis]